MSFAYVFTTGKQTALTRRLDGSNLPDPQKGTHWCVEGLPGIEGFDPEMFERQGYQI